jgi:hypothetical protein
MGIPINYHDEESKKGRIIFSLEEIEADVTFNFSVYNDTTNVALLKRLGSGEIQLQFRSCPELPIKSSKKKKQHEGTTL